MAVKVFSISSNLIKAPVNPLKMKQFNKLEICFKAFSLAFLEDSTG